MEFLEKIRETACIFFEKYVITPILNADVIDAIDVLLLAIVLYGLYRFLRTRRAGRVLMGLALVVVLSLLVTLLELPALSYIVRLFAASAFFCIVVILQPEFRDALERLGNSTLLNPTKNRISRKKFDITRAAVEETVDAVGKMSESKTGALIVFEGLTLLGDYIQSGKIIDARITSHMLCNIFFDKAPLHDGALVIRNLRIHAASCVLPSAKGKLDFSSVGTRHRAAVGLTEVSDALVIVVSEETGIVSVAQEGKMLRDIDRKTLYDILMTYLAGNTYARFKRANLRSHYLEMLDQAGSVNGKKKEKRPSRFNDPSMPEEKEPAAPSPEESEFMKPLTKEELSAVARVEEDKQEDEPNG